MTVVGPTPDFNHVAVEWGPFVYLDGSVPTGEIVVTYVGGDMVDRGLSPERSIAIGTGKQAVWRFPLTTIELDVGGVLKPFAFVAFMLPATNDPDIEGGGGEYVAVPRLSQGGGTRSEFTADVGGDVVRLNDPTLTPLNA